jgi:hypothetical protein
MIPGQGQRLYERKQTFAAIAPLVAIPFVTKGKLVSGLTIEDAIARRRARRL